MFILRALARYWLITLILIIIMSLQLGCGLVVAHSVVTGQTPETAEQKTVALSSAERPTSAKPLSKPASTPSPTNTPTFTPSPTRTPTRTPPPTPTGTRQPTLTPSTTPTSNPQPTPLGPGATVTVPILMYHYLSAPPFGADEIRLDLSVNPAQFESHLAYLRQAGYETISMKQLAFALSGRADLPLKPIVITFDDGYRDNYKNAYPLLRKYGYTGTFFIFNYPIDTNNVDYLTWEMVIEMHKAGMEFGSHSYSHPNMRGKDVDFLVYEILGSKEAIEKRTGESVRFFAYPSGRYDNLTIRVLKSANFWGAVTTQWGAEHSYTDRFEILRVRVSGDDSVQNLANKLNLF